ncbi:hypothetical protein Tco_0933194 [Tanacetum coccineum]
MKKMNEKPGHVRPANGFYDKLNAVKFVPQTELSYEQVYGLSANEIASNASNPATPVTPFVHNRPPPSQVLFHLLFLKSYCFFQSICSSNCLCEDLRSACDREHTKVLELEAEVLKQQKMCIDTSSASNAIFEINKLRDQLQGKDTTIRNLDAQINIMKVLNVGSTEGSCDQQALETELTQLKDALTSVRIQIDGYKAENVNLKRRYEELSKSNAYSRSTFTAKINALTAENAKLKTELSGKKSSGSTAFEKPKVLASGMYTNSSKTKPATESRKPMPKSHTRNHRILPSTSVNARRAANHNRKLNVVDHNQNHNVKPQWKPTERHFALYDNCPLTRIMEPIVEPLELTPSVSSSSKVTMISRSQGSSVADSIAARLTRPTAYKFKTDFALSFLSGVF